MFCHNSRHPPDSRLYRTQHAFVVASLHNNYNVFIYMTETFNSTGLPSTSGPGTESPLNDMLFFFCCAYERLPLRVESNQLDMR
uniref:Uncharacterized protein n=1 Tax=Anopheles minimus TaxID=112268 RepID=A0A182WN40_9DIPT